MSATATASTPRSVLAAAWAVMLGGGGTNIAFNVYHAVHWGNLALGFALLYGLVPVFISMCQSHIVAEHRGAGTTVKVITFALMTAAMANSAGSTATVLRPTAGPVLCWLFPVTLDAGALVALYVILNYRSRQAAEADEIERARTAVGEAAARAAQADADAAAVRGQLAAERAAAAEQLAAEQDRAASIAADLAAVRAELQAVRDAERERRRRGTKSGTRGGTKRRSTAGTGGGTNGGTDDLSIELRAFEIVAARPTINGTELAQELGVSDGYGRRLRRQVASRDGEPAES